jgi:hypothetical protein
VNDPRAIIAGLGVLAGAVGCTEVDAGSEATVVAEAREVVLGPVDGHDLPGTDLDRVTAGDMAPDFTAMSRGGEPITLSQYRGEKNVVLVFYRGHW